MDLTSSLYGAGAYIRLDGSSTTTGIIPFALGTYYPDEAYALFGGISSSDFAAQVGVSDTTFYIIGGGEGGFNLNNNGVNLQFIAGAGGQGGDYQGGRAWIQGGQGHGNGRGGAVYLVGGSPEPATFGAYGWVTVGDAVFQPSYIPADTNRYKSLWVQGNFEADLISFLTDIVCYGNGQWFGNHLYQSGSAITLAESVQVHVGDNNSSLGRLILSWDGGDSQVGFRDEDGYVSGGYKFLFEPALIVNTAQSQFSVFGGTPTLTTPTNTTNLISAGQTFAGSALTTPTRALIVESLFVGGVNDNNSHSGLLINHAISGANTLTLATSDGGSNGVKVNYRHAGSTTVSLATSLDITATHASSGNTTNLIGINVEVPVNASTGKPTNWYGIKLPTSGAGFVTTNAYGIFLQTIKSGFPAWFDVAAECFFREAGCKIYSSAALTLDFVATTTANITAGTTINFAISAATQLSVTSNNLTFAQGAAKTFSIAQKAAASTTGDALTVAAGQHGAGTDISGGALNLSAGASSGAGSGAAVNIRLSKPGLSGSSTVSQTTLVTFSYTSTNASQMLFNTDTSNKSILVGRVTSGGARTLTVQGGGATTGGSNLNGGTLDLNGGIATGTGTSQVRFGVAGGGGSGTSDSNPAITMTLTKQQLDFENGANDTFINWATNRVLKLGANAVNVLNISDSTETVFNEDSNNIDFRMEGDTDANLFFLDASVDRIGISVNTPAHKFDVNGMVNTPGTTGNTYRWNAASTAPATTATPVFTAYYGGNTNALGDPTGWVLVNIAGTDRKIPFYAV